MAEITAKKSDSERSVTVQYDFPDTVAGLIEKYGEEAVHGAAVGTFTINLQALLRRHIDKTDEELQELATNWVPGTRGPAVKKTPLEKAKSALGSLTPEQRAELLAALQGG